VRSVVGRLPLVAFASALVLALGCARSSAPPPVVAEAQLARAGPAYRALVMPPFVLVTNAPPSLEDDAKSLVSAVQERFRADLFDAQPTTTTTIWLFASERAFHEEAGKLGKFDMSPFYSVTQKPQFARAYFNPFAHELFAYPEHQYGLRKTLVHELVHVYVEANHPSAATWIHEGLASLFGYAVRTRSGRVEVGPRMWFPIVMNHTYASAPMPSVERVVDASHVGFHFGADEGGFYEVSAFIIYWLHEHQLLRPFLAAYRDRGSESSGKTLSAVTHRSLEELDVELRRFAKARAAAL
jgi:hypothetical protein